MTIAGEEIEYRLSWRIKVDHGMFRSLIGHHHWLLALIVLSRSSYVLIAVRKSF